MPLVSLLAVCAPLAAQQQDLSAVKIEAVPVAGRVHMLLGSGGNIGVIAGEDGVVMIDDQFAPLAPKIRAAIAMLSDRPVRFLINTHWHGDHTGGNEALGKTGAVIVAHENVRRRMSVEQLSTFTGRRTPPAPAEALPVITFDREVALHLAGEEIEVTHVAAAHTDGDAIIRFTKSNVVHMGDCFFNGMYPFIDSGSGGTVKGVLAAVDRVLASTDENTKIIPGHGPLASKADLQAYRDMLATTSERIAKLIRQGRTQEQVIAAQPTKDYDAKWAGGFWTPEQWVQRMYVTLKREQAD
jgi:glyoxylase-like metal-dependent hydrolase (beta-lactamase superfamily II)